MPSSIRPERVSIPPDHAPPPFAEEAGSGADFGLAFAQAEEEMPEGAAAPVPWDLLMPVQAVVSKEAEPASEVALSLLETAPMRLNVPCTNPKDASVGLAPLAAMETPPPHPGAGPDATPDVPIPPHRDAPPMGKAVPDAARAAPPQAAMVSPPAADRPDPPPGPVLQETGARTNASSAAQAPAPHVSAPASQGQPLAAVPSPSDPLPETGSEPAPGAVSAPGSAAAPPASDTPRVLSAAPAPAAVTSQLVEVIRQAPDGPVELTLRPEELGRLRITLTPQESGMIVSIQAERGETGDLLRRHIDLLDQELSDLGYTDIRFDFGQGTPRRDTPRNTAPALEGTPPGPGPAQADQTPARRRTMGVLDIRI
ncbi:MULTISPECIES: flagellar hook-length control protein FliK [Actibacterium]|uniref:Flagellar hook-length control protein-like C-terminal domain-containing protein n=1 Tax=Actibacterium naphthalenivorans TaxID=1614693 RepID=A0A840CBM6_9RHOB|nr:MULTISPECIES: flagellar hook-length control protein FliK [Actibacterium]ALG88988.1 hypothetical protein TQ29_00965 [Actibacterium sp. EMB200-NS6]MBB4021462.1 hypothetical protein [Actibacterium naphthalenivorans]